MNNFEIRRFDLAKFNRRDRRYFTGLLAKMEGDLLRSGAISEEIVKTLLICIVSFLCQGVANVAWPNGRKLSLGICGIVISATGSGKSLVQSILMEAIERYLCHRNTEGLDGVPEDLFTEDATREAILQSLHACPVLGLFTDEGGQIKELLNSGSTLAKLVDNAPIRAARVGSGRMAILAYKFCMMLQIQPDIFEALKHRLGTGSGGVGLGNRFAIAFASPNTSISSRHEVCLSNVVEVEYEQRVNELLDECILNAKNKFQTLPTLQVNAAGKEFLKQLDHDTRRSCAPGQPWFHIAEYLSRHVERVLRLSGVLHVFEYGPVGEISLETLQRAEMLGDWYVNSFARGMFVPPEPTQLEIDARDLECALLNWAQTSGCCQFRQSDARTYALNFGLTPSRFTRALAFLGKQRKICIFLVRNVPFIQVNSH